MRQSFEEFMDSPEEVQNRLNSFMYSAWANRFNTTVEMIDRVVSYGENISCQGIDYEYCDIEADIIPSFRANSIKGVLDKLYLNCKLVVNTQPTYMRFIQLIVIDNQLKVEIAYYDYPEFPHCFERVEIIHEIVLN